MVAMTSSAKISKQQFINRLAADYPELGFIKGPRERWSPKTNTITYDPGQPLKQLQYGVLHELAHALLGHHTYQSDFELVNMESKAWEMAAGIGRKYGVKLSSEHIQNCLDTYRDWLYRRSTCPTCQSRALQPRPGVYRCFNCQTTWKVSTKRFSRPYRLADVTKTT